MRVGMRFFMVVRVLRMGCVVGSMVEGFVE